MNITADPIPQLVRGIAIPASVGFFFNTMYNFVDTYFAGKISTDALAALSLSFPVFFIILSVGSGIGQGTTALIANAMGAGNNEKAREYFAQALVFSLCGGVALTVIGLLAAPALFRLLGASGEYLQISLRYMNVIVAGNILFLIQGTLNSLLNALGNTRVFRNTLFGGFVANCILDPWFLYGGAGIPAMGITGIALATLLCQLGGCIYILHHVRKTKLWPGVCARNFKPDARVLREIAGQALPASLNMMTVALGIFVITWFISRFSKEAVAAYGIATRVEQMILLPTIGLNFAVLTLVGQNNGAGKMDRVREAWRTTTKYGLAMMAAGGVLLWIVRRPLMAVFTQDTTVVGEGIDYLGVASITLCAYVILFQTVFMLQGLKKPLYGLYIGIYRQVLAPILVFHFLAFTAGWGLWGIWWGICLVTWSAAVFTFFLGLRILHRREEAVA